MVTVRRRLSGGRVTVCLAQHPSRCSGRTQLVPSAGRVAACKQHNGTAHCQQIPSDPHAASPGLANAMVVLHQHNHGCRWVWLAFICLAPTCYQMSRTVMCCCCLRACRGCSQEGCRSISSGGQCLCFARVCVSVCMRLSLLFLTRRERNMRSALVLVLHGLSCAGCLSTPRAFTMDVRIIGCWGCVMAEVDQGCPEADTRETGGVRGSLPC